MAKKKNSPHKKFPVTRRSARRNYIAASVLALITTLGLGTAVGPWSTTFGTKKIFSRSAMAQPQVTIPPPSNPTKEYIYAGSRLIATEEPIFGSHPAPPAPESLIATTDGNLTDTLIAIDWQPSPGAHHYQVERTERIGTSYQLISASVQATSFSDSGVSSVKGYLYRVRAVNAAGNASPYSNVDVATAISFEDNSLQAGTTLIKAQHINQLRQAVDAVRATTASLGPANWAESVSAGVTRIKAAHILELRTKLEEARNALGLAPCSYTAVAPGSLIRKEHIEQLRSCVK